MSLITLFLIIETKSQEHPSLIFILVSFIMALYVTETEHQEPHVFDEIFVMILMRLVMAITCIETKFQESEF